MDASGLYVDPDFPACPESIFHSWPVPAEMEWKRASELSKKPCLIKGSASRFDINQGSLGNCWFLAAFSSLTMNKKLLKAVMPEGQDFDSNYTGQFQFNFWRYGAWETVVIDDYLPVQDGQLAFLHSDCPDEFWVALVEKAYAKLFGSYQALDGGSALEAMVDFTGGLSEVVMTNSEEISRKLLLQAKKR